MPGRGGGVKIRDLVGIVVRAHVDRWLPLPTSEVTPPTKDDHELTNSSGCVEVPVHRRLSNTVL